MLVNYTDKIAGFKQQWRDAGGQGITVALLDSGITVNHPALQAACATHIGRAVSITTPGNIADINGHGTKMAGLISADANGAVDGIMGVAPLCNLLCIKVLNDDQQADGANIAKGLDAVINLPATVKVDVVNLSLNILEEEYQEIKFTNNQTIKDKITLLAQKGIIIVAAAGNNDRLTKPKILFPAADSNIISVGATEMFFQPATINKRVDFIFFNNRLTTTDMANGYTAVTEFSSPYTALVSGTIAAILSAERNLPPGIAKINAVKNQLNAIAADFSTFNNHDNSKLILYNTNPHEETIIT